jgi:hypothetical protein
MEGIYGDSRDPIYETEKRGSTGKIVDKNSSTSTQ